MFDMHPHSGVWVWNEILARSRMNSSSSFASGSNLSSTANSCTLNDMVLLSLGVVSYGERVWWRRARASVFRNCVFASPDR